MAERFPEYDGKELQELKENEEKTTGKNYKN